MSATNTATKEATAPSETINDLVHEAMLEYEKALNSGIQFQEDAIKLWKDLLAKAGAPTAFQTALESASAELFPNAHKRVSEFVETYAVNMMLANRAGSQASDLFGESLGIYQSASISEALARVQDLNARSLAAVRGNIHTALNKNAKIVDSWKNLASLCPIKSFCALAQAFVETPLRAA